MAPMAVFKLQRSAMVLSIPSSCMGRRLWSPSPMAAQSLARSGFVDLLTPSTTSENRIRTNENMPFVICHTFLDKKCYKQKDTRAIVSRICIIYSMQCNVPKCSVKQCNATQCNGVERNGAECAAPQCSAAQYHVMLHYATLCSYYMHMQHISTYNGL